jgi:hypothetical protein
MDPKGERSCADSGPRFWGLHHLVSELVFVCILQTEGDGKEQFDTYQVVSEQDFVCIFQMKKIL